MDKLKLYLDTCVIGYLDQPNEPVKMGATLVLWNQLRLGLYDVFISQLTVEELCETKEPRKTRLLDQLNEIDYQSLYDNEEISSLRDEYLKNNVLTATSRDDLWHIAFATIATCDVIISWNFRHFVNPRTIRRINETNVRFGYPAVQIMSPAQFLEGENEL